MVSTVQLEYLAIKSGVECVTGHTKYILSGYTQLFTCVNVIVKMA